MEIKRNTILVAGGASGYGFGIACSLARFGQKVIITGNCHSRLAQAASCHRNIIPLYHDITDEHELSAFVVKLTLDYPEINIFINNTGNDFGSSSAFETNSCPDRLIDNYFSGIRITEELLPQLEYKANAAVIDLSPLTMELDGLQKLEAIKNALVSYYEMLRHSLRKQLNVGVFNVAALGLKAGCETEEVVKKVIGILGTRVVPGSEEKEVHVPQQINTIPWLIGNN